MDNTTDLIFACFCGVLAFLALVGLVYIMVDETIKFKRVQRRLKEQLNSVNESN